MDVTAVISLIAFSAHAERLPKVRIVSVKRIFNNGDETVFLFRSDDSVLAVARRGGGNAGLCRSKPLYRQWQIIRPMKKIKTANH
ncbi:MAG: hypothetical protein GWP06_11155 [Actinobacteria bacterium]|nr:hypothetical protein [Actinomycetota bacterium]